MQDTVYTAASLKLSPGDGLFIYSDGVTEAANPQGVQYGEERLARDLAELVRADGRALLDSMLERVRAHCGDAPQTDDIAALALRWTAAPRDR